MTSVFSKSCRGVKHFAVATLLLMACAVQTPVRALERSDMLLDIVLNCVTPGSGNYCSLCRLPRNDAGCGAALECNRNTEVWALTGQYTAIRDIKMCGCPTEFVHGLALPTYPVTGVEDPRRPEGIWQFAWDAAIGRMDAESIALVVNPGRQRSQNQLHVHIVRLAKGARENLEKESPRYVGNLDQIWATASASAASKGLEDYGVLVSQRPQRDFLVVVTANSPEKLFTKFLCD